jgi:hypothetical protein
MSKLLNTMEADCETSCHCCGRVHRKLFLVDGYWMGRNCKQDYEMYKNFPKRNSIAWRGYEKNFDKVVSMIKAKQDDINRCQEKIKSTQDQSIEIEPETAPKKVDNMNTIENENKKQAELIKDLKEQIRKLNDKTLKTTVIKTDHYMTVIDKDGKQIGIIHHLKIGGYHATSLSCIDNKTVQTIYEAQIYLESVHQK